MENDISAVERFRQWLVPLAQKWVDMNSWWFDALKNRKKEPSGSLASDAAKWAERGYATRGFKDVD